MTQPPSIEALTGALRADVDAVWQRILREQTDLERAWLDLTPPQRLRRLRALQASVRTLADSADEIAARHITGAMRDAYETGAWATATAAATSAVFDAVDLDAVTRLAQDTMGDLLHATQGVRDSTKTMVRMMTRDWVRTKLYTGLTAEQSGVRLAADLADHGITSLIYANGNRVGLSTYTDMVTRTRTAEAYQAGGFNQGERLEIQWWEVFDGISCVAAGTRFLPYGDLTTIVRADFSGRAYRITARTPSGPNALTVGPNHPVLTQRGWVRAHLLTERDQLVYDLRAQNATTLAELHLEQVPVVEDVFTAAAELSPVASRTPTSEDLHGDAVFCKGEVNVVAVHRCLLVERDASSGEHGSERDLVGADAHGALVAGDCSRGDDVRRPDQSARGFVGASGPGSPFVGPCPVVPASQRLAAAEGESLVLEVGVDLFRAQPESGGDLARTHTVPVQAFDVVSGQHATAHPGAGASAEPSLGVVLRVEDDAAVLAGRGTAGTLVELAHGMVLCPVETIVHGVYHGAVFDATTTTGAFNADGFIVKNCGWEFHDDTLTANGMIVSLDDARAYPISHPNCQRSTTPRPDIHNAAEARHAEQTTTAQQRADQAAAETARAAAHAQIPRRVGLDRRVAASRQRSQDLQIGVVRSPAQQRHLARLATKGPAPALPSEVAARVVAAATTVEPQLTSGMTALADQVGGSLAGLDFRLKSVKSLTEKITEGVVADEKTAQQVADHIFDVNRYTILLKPDQYARSAQAAINQLRADGNAIKVKNYWRVPLTTNPYQGINVQITKQGGQRLELQFHTEVSLHVKEHELHDIYKLAKTEKNPLKRAEYIRQEVAAAEKIPVPRGVAAVS